MLDLDRLMGTVRGEAGEMQRQVRAGIYRAIVKGHSSLARLSVTASWLEDGQVLPNALRVAPSLLDVVEAIGTPVAIVSEDGQPARPLVLGAVTDETQPITARPSWIRALLHEAAKRAHLEIGATSGVRVKVGTNTGDVNPLADTVALQAGSAEARLKTAGTFAVSNTTGELVDATGEALEASQAIIDGLVDVLAAVTAAAAGPGATTPVTNGTLLGFLNAGLDATTLADAKAKIDAALVILDTFRE